MACGDISLIYLDDQIDGILAILDSGTATENELTAKLRLLTPGHRLVHVLQTYRQLTAEAHLIVARDGALSLTRAGRERVRGRTYPHGVPPIFTLDRYTHEREHRPALNDRYLRILAILSSYDDPLSVREVEDEWLRRYWFQTSIKSHIDDLIVYDLVEELVRPESTARFRITDDGLDRYRDELSLLLPRGNYNRLESPMIAAFGELEQIRRRPLLEPGSLPTRVFEAVLAAIGELDDRLYDLSQEDEIDPTVLEILPELFVEKYDRAFFTRLHETLVASTGRLRHDPGYRVTTIAEAIVLREVLRVATKRVLESDLGGLRPPSDRERRSLVHLDARLFDDHFFEVLFNDRSSLMYSAMTAGDNAAPNISFSSWFEPFLKADAPVEGDSSDVALAWLNTVSVPLVGNRQAPEFEY